MPRPSGLKDMTGTEVPLYDAAEFEALRRAGALAAATLDFIAGHIRPGVSTGEIDLMCESFMRDHGGIPATIGYHGYKHASCISVNHVVTHGIPSDDKRLSEGDIVNVDVTPILDGFHGDSSRTYLVGEPPVLARRLVKATEEALWAGIDVVRPGATLGDVGAAIQAVADRERFSVVQDYCGHGTGVVFHDAPQVLHYGKKGTGLRLEAGMVFTIEPMLNAGKAGVKTLPDGWTAVTRDRSLSAQFEHTIGVTETGVEVFTLSKATARGA